MKKIMLVVMVTLLVAGCTTLQRDYISNTKPIDSVYLETSGLMGFTVGVVVAGTTYWYLDKYQNNF